MHHSRLCNLVIDCHADALPRHAQFWSRALGRPIRTADEDGDGYYAVLDTPPDELRILLRRVDHDSRVHLDIETDDLDAEAARLEELGAKRIELVRGRWWVMEAPSGHRFCVVQRQGEVFGSHVNRWD